MFKTMSLASLILMPLGATASLIPSSGFGVDKNFVDDGVYTTEYRTDGTVWEWLDLTVTNGISFEAILEDMSNNNRIDNSGGVLTNNAFSNSIANLSALTEYESIGWELQSMDSTAAMVNSYFGLSLAPNLDEPSRNDFSYYYNFGTNTEIMESFVHLFGDTVHEGYEDSNFEMEDKNPDLANIGYTEGLTSSFVEYHWYNDDGSYRGSSKQFIKATVADWQLHEYFTDPPDTIYFGESRTSTGYHPNRGVWLARKVSVGEPNGLAILLTGVVGLLLARRKKQKH